MSVLGDLQRMGHEEVVIVQEPTSGYRAIIAVHSTRLGPATGGTRFWPYATMDEAMTDVLRLSRGMTYKNAVAGLALGGGKAVIIGDPHMSAGREALFLAHGRAVNRLQGRFITAEDVGTRPADFEIAARETPYVAGFGGRGGDPSPWTALGVVRGIEAAAAYRWGSSDLTGKHVVVQGCGNVGGAVASHLRERGAVLTVSDTEGARAAACAAAVQGRVVEPDMVYDVEADIFAPCAMGAILNDDTIPRLRVEVVAGAANNQLLRPDHADAVAARGILYVPDYVINAGGVISGSVALLGETPERMAQRVHDIHDTVRLVLELADRNGVNPAAAADQLAESRLQ